MFCALLTFDQLIAKRNAPICLQEMSRVPAGCLVLKLTDLCPTRVIRLIRNEHPFY